jgi:hypothetical protein
LGEDAVVVLGSAADMSGVVEPMLGEDAGAVDPDAGVAERESSGQDQ